MFDYSNKHQQLSDKIEVTKRNGDLFTNNSKQLLVHLFWLKIHVLWTFENKTMATKTYLNNFWDQKRIFRRLVKNTIRYSNFVDTFSMYYTLSHMCIVWSLRESREANTDNEQLSSSLFEHKCCVKPLVIALEEKTLSQPLYLSIDRDTVERSTSGRPWDY